MQELYKTINVGCYYFGPIYSKSRYRNCYTCNIYIDDKKKKVTLKSVSGKKEKVVGSFDCYSKILASDLPEIPRPPNSEKPSRQDMKYWTQCAIDELFLDSFTRKNLSITNYSRHHSKQIMENYRNGSHIVKIINDDNLENIAQFLLLFNKTPQELRVELGKGLWAKLVNNSKSENNFLLSLMKSEDMDQNLSFVREILQRDLYKIKQSIKLFGSRKDLYEQRAALYFIYNNLDSMIAKGTSLSYLSGWYGDGLTRDGFRTLGMIKDVAKMCNACDVEFQVNPKWSERRIHEYHDGVSRLYNSLTYGTVSKGGFQVSKYVSGVLSDIEDSDGVLVLCSNEAYRAESTRMRHCISSYAGSASASTYVAMHVTKNGENLTLGCRVVKSKEGIAKLNYEQAYRAQNAYISKDNEKFCRSLIKSINSKIQEKWKEIETKSKEEIEALKKEHKHLFNR